MPPVTTTDIRHETAHILVRTRDPFEHIRTNEAAAKHSTKRGQLSTHDGCLEWGVAVIILSRYSHTLLYNLHNTPSGNV